MNIGKVIMLCVFLIGGMIIDYIFNDDDWDNDDYNSYE
jgi:hypothetical protein